jgi:hypothetical protein
MKPVWLEAFPVGNERNPDGHDHDQRTSFNYLGGCSSGYDSH